MIANQMRSKTQASFLDDISYSDDPVFMDHQHIQTYSDEILNIILDRTITKETEALKEELIQ